MRRKKSKTNLGIRLSIALAAGLLSLGFAQKDLLAESVFTTVKQNTYWCYNRGGFEARSLKMRWSGATELAHSWSSIYGDAESKHPGDATTVLFTDSPSGLTVGQHDADIGGVGIPTTHDSGKACLTQATFYSKPDGTGDTGLAQCFLCGFKAGGDICDCYNVRPYE